MVDNRFGRTAEMMIGFLRRRLSRRRSTFGFAFATGVLHGDVWAGVDAMNEPFSKYKPSKEAEVAPKISQGRRKWASDRLERARFICFGALSD